MYESEKQYHKKTFQTYSTGASFYPKELHIQKNAKEQNKSNSEWNTSNKQNDHPRQNLSSLLTNNSSPKAYQPQKKVLFAQFPHISKAVNQSSDSSMETINKLTDEISHIESLMLSNNYQIEKMGDLKELDRILQTAYEELKNLKLNNENIHESIRQQFFESVKKIEKELIEMQKQRKALRERCNEIQLKQQKNKDEKLLSKEIKESLCSMRQKTGNISKQLKNLKKQRIFSKGKTFQKLQNLRVKYMVLLKQEQNKRVECDKVIYELLQGTCNRAQAAIRRSVY